MKAELLFYAQEFLKRKSTTTLIIVLSNYSGVVWTENIWYVFKFLRHSEDVARLAPSRLLCSSCYEKNNERRGLPQKRTLRKSRTWPEANVTVRNANISWHSLTMVSSDPEVEEILKEPLLTTRHILSVSLLNWRDSGIYIKGLLSMAICNVHHHFWPHHCWRRKPQLSGLQFSSAFLPFYIVHLQEWKSN